MSCAKLQRGGVKVGTLQVFNLQQGCLMCQAPVKWRKGWDSLQPIATAKLGCAKLQRGGVKVGTDGNKWGDTPKWICQAPARWSKGWDIILQVHDELVIELCQAPARWRNGWDIKPHGVLKSWVTGMCQAPARWRNGWDKPLQTVTSRKTSRPRSAKLQRGGETVGTHPVRRKPPTGNRVPSSSGVE